MKEHVRVYEIGDRIKVVGYRQHTAAHLPADRAADALQHAAIAAEAEAEAWGLDRVEADLFVQQSIAAELAARGILRSGGKRAEALSRAKRRIYELIACNQWDWFVTLTLDAEKVARRGYARADLDAWRADFAQWLRNRRRLYGGSYRYLLVPETHADGQAWHMHGVLSGLAGGDVGDFPAGAPRDLIAGGYRNWMPFSEAFGFCSLAPIRDQGRCASYMAKYVTKDAARSVQRFGGHLYYSSRGLDAARTIYEGRADLGDQWEWDYIGEHANVAWRPISERGAWAELAVEG